MASRGRGRRGRPRDTGQAPPAFDQPPVFDQQAFVEAVGIVAAAIAYAGIAGSQGGPSNLQRFRAHHPPTFIGGGDPMVADHWFMQVEKVLEAMDKDQNIGKHGYIGNWILRKYRKYRKISVDILTKISVMEKLTKIL